MERAQTMSCVEASGGRAMEILECLLHLALSVSSEINYRSRSTPLSCEMSAGMSASFDTTFATLPRASGAVAKLPGSMSEAVGVCAGLDDGAAEGESVDDGGA